MTPATRLLFLSMRLRGASETQRRRETARAVALGGLRLSIVEGRATDPAYCGQLMEFDDEIEGHR